MTKTMNLKGLEKNIIFERIFTGDNFQNITMHLKELH